MAPRKHPLPDLGSSDSVMVFVGVTTGGSRIHRIFPLWAELMGLTTARLHGLDLPVDVAADAVREAVRWIADTDCIRGALVTTHKIAVHRFARDLFSAFDPDADWLGEVSAVVKGPGGLVGHALDTVTAGLALDRIVPRPYWARHPGAGALVLGSGGAGLALTAHLLQRGPVDRPASVVLSDVDGDRLASAGKALQARDDRKFVSYRQVRGAEDNDDLLQALPPNSLVVNATGLGKDRPGSPLTPDARFPQGGVVWEFNYRGPRDFLVQAQARRAQDGLTVADGWTYFLYGWAHVMAEVFGVVLDDALFARLEAAAEGTR